MFKKNLATAFSSTKGAIDLGSVMVGVVVLGILGGTTAATVFAIIPWAQDNAAKSDIKTIAAAESSYQSSSNSDDLSATTPQYATDAQLKAAKLISNSNSTVVNVGANNSCWVAVAKSTSGTVFWADSSNVNPTKYTSSSSSLCGDITSTPAVSAPAPTGSPTTSAPAVTPVGEMDLVVNSSYTNCAAFVLPINGNVNATIDWGDGSTSKATSNYPTHTYSAAASRPVVVKGVFDSFTAQYNTDYSVEDCITSVTKWSNTNTTNLSNAFSGTKRLTNVTEIPATTTNLKSMFANNSTFNGTGLNNWNTSNVTNMSYLFSNDANFNQPLNNWDTSNVTNMGSMFSFAMVFNQSISNWNTAKVTDFSHMFANARVFNQPLNSWNTSNVTAMNDMFGSAYAFNQPLSNWDTSNVTVMNSMFTSTVAFNQSLNNWDMSSVTAIGQMFSYASGFNQPLLWNKSGDLAKLTSSTYMFYNNPKFNSQILFGPSPKVVDATFMFSNATAFNSPISWTTLGSSTSLVAASAMFSGASAFNQSVTNLQSTYMSDVSGMFQDASVFNQPLTGWTLPNNASFSQMFMNASKFNQPLNGLNTTNLTSMTHAFDGASAFNQSLSSWNTSKITDMQYVFNNATVFNQNISGWNVAKVTNYPYFKTGSALSTANTPAFTF